MARIPTISGVTRLIAGVQPIAISDGANLDAFSRLRVSSPSYIFDAQLTYDLHPLLFESVTDGGGGTATIAHDSTNRCALMTFSGAGNGAKAFMQSYEWFPYQPGRSQLFFITFNFIETKANTLKFAGVGDGTNGIQLELNGSTVQISLYSGTRATQTVTQANWNIDKFNGRGQSRVNLDLTKTQILVIDYQALYVGRVRVGFDVGGVVYYVHEFIHANLIAVPYIQIASLPVRVGMTATGSSSTTMRFICSSVISEGGNNSDIGYQFSIEGTGTAGNGTAAHILSVRPNTTFNSIPNRTKFVLEDVDITVTGNQPVSWALVVGQAISGTTAFIDVNATYSAFEYNTLGTISGSPAIVMAQGYVAASATTKNSSSQAFTQRYPITLDAAGAVRSLGTISVIATGLGGTSATRAVLNWREIR